MGPDFLDIQYISSCKDKCNGLFIYCLLLLNYSKYMDYAKYISKKAAIEYSKELKT